MTAKLAYFQWNGELTHLQEDRQVLRIKMLAGLRWLQEQYAAQGWEHIAQPEEVVEQVLDNVWLMQVGDAWVGFSVDRPWFMTRDVISEDFIMFPADLAEVVAALTAVGQVVGAVRLEVGTRAVSGGRHAALARLYEAQGLAVSTLELTKEIA